MFERLRRLIRLAAAPAWAGPTIVGLGLAAAVLEGAGLYEATNALDVETEQAFQLALEQYSHNRTMVVIAPRLSTVQAANQIIVMAKGRVIEVGSPDQLLKRQGHFSRLHEFQHGRTAMRAT
ncbi:MULTISPECIES: hypothetical protein [unclassified Mesorhizobium]|uniref:hypothetical protein n=1 Tax=unclassified Mesorhizobium TaxID=325217 RepID=UPI00193908CC|nr:MULTISPECIES: hypothetical protein [unclassified Mesorhizobium]BCH15659.1 hypothetical protein MesoLjLa_25100 [Mesorhizobium sp. L-2-11]